jgi:hypothetical protein
MAQLVHRAFAYALDLTFVVAAGFGLVGGIAVFMFVRTGRPAPEPDKERPPADARQTRTSVGGSAGALGRQQR